MSAGILAIDAGQTGIKVRHRSPSGMTEWKDPGLRTSLPVLPQLVAVLHSAVGRGVQATQIGLGVSGLTGDADDAARKLMLAAAELGASSVTLAHDSITAFLGALGDHRGSVVAAGTGVVTLAVGAREVARVDGWGNIISDAGSGYWIGRAAFEAALRDHDGRGPSTILSEAVRAEFPDLEGAYILLQADPDRVRRVAGYAGVVAEAAESGDAVADAILRAAAHELAHSAVTSLTRVGEAGQPAPLIRGVGGVFGSSILAAEFIDAVIAALPRADVAIGRGDPLDGAETLLNVTAQSALSPHLARATAASPLLAR